MDGPYHRRLQLSDREYADLLRRLDAKSVDVPTDLRNAPRHPWPLADVELVIEHPSGGAARFLVYARNISRTGIAILHGGYVHAGSPCRLALENRDGKRMLVRGKVRYCRLITGSCHEVGIGFASELDLRQLRMPIRDDHGESVEGHASACALRGAVLLAEPFVPDLLLLKHRLSAVGLEIHEASTFGAALDTVRLRKIDIVLSGFDVTTDEGLRWLGQMREVGFTRPIMVLSADTDNAAMYKALTNGATEIVARPYHLNLLLALMECYLGYEPRPAPVLSSISGTYSERRLEELAELCDQVKGSGCAYGFDHLTAAAILAGHALTDDPESEAARDAVTKLARTCRGLHAGSVEAA
jgi:response regulator of citrate/malate metabolism